MEWFEVSHLNNKVRESEKEGRKEKEKKERERK